MPKAVESDRARELRSRADIAAVDVARKRGEVVDREIVRSLLEILTAGHAQNVAGILGQVRRLPEVDSVPAEARAAILRVVESRLRAGTEDWRGILEGIRTWLDTGELPSEANGARRPRRRG